MISKTIDQKAKPDKQQKNLAKAMQKRHQICFHLFFLISPDFSTVYHNGEVKAC